MERYFGTKAAADLLGVHISTVRKWDYKGILKPAGRTPTGRRRYTEAQLMEFLTRPKPIAEHYLPARELDSHCTTC